MGIDGVKFIEKCVESSAANADWVTMKQPGLTMGTYKNTQKSTA